MARNVHSHSTGAAAAASPGKGRATRANSSASSIPARKGGSASTSDRPETPMDREAVARLAYSYWEARGRNGGSPEEDWLRAEEALGLASRNN